MTDETFTPAHRETLEHYAREGGRKWNEQPHVVAIRAALAEIARLTKELAAAERVIKAYEKRWAVSDKRFREAP